MDRPYINFLVDDLENLIYHSEQDDPEILNSIYIELFSYRRTKKSKILLRTVEKKILARPGGKFWLKFFLHENNNKSQNISNHDPKNKKKKGSQYSENSNEDSLLIDIMREDMNKQE